MNLHWIDWAIVAGFIIVITGIVFVLRQYTRSVADFLVANRCAKRYLLSIGQTIAMMGALVILGTWQMFYEGGISAFFWNQMVHLPVIILCVTAFCIYRFRQTRAMTLAQFFEIRYSKSFRICSGLISFVAGVICFGIFPAIGARFFIYFCGLPETIFVLGIEVSSFVAVMIILLAISLLYTWLGGQIAVIITDFCQYFFCNITFVAIVIFFLWTVDWSRVTEIFVSTPEGNSLVHPFKGENIEEFNVWYFVITCFHLFYAILLGQGAQAYHCSATSPHEAKMARILEYPRAFGMTLFWLVIPMGTYALLRDPGHALLTDGVNNVLATIENEAIRRQMTIPVFLANFLPLGLKGALCASILAAFISTHDTALHSWGSILVQDVIMPFRKKPFEPKQHMLFLRLSVLGVAVFIFFFSLLFRQTQAILMFITLSSAIFGGAGAAVIGGLYWKKGTTAAAFAALIAGAAIATTGFVLEQVWLDVYGHNFPIHGKYVAAITMVFCSFIYILVSLMQNKNFNIDRMLHRGKYAIGHDRQVDREKTESLAKSGFFMRILIRLGLTTEFTFWDKVILVIGLTTSTTYFTTFAIGTVYNLFFDVSEEDWILYWKTLICIIFVLSIGSTIWFAIGGWCNSKDMLKRLGSIKRDERDDGIVIDHHSRDEQLLDDQ